MKYLPIETCEYLVSLGCKSESDYRWHGWDTFEVRHHMATGSTIPAFSLEDILRKDNAEKIWRREAAPMAVSVACLVYDNPDTWPQEVSKLILGDKTNQDTKE